MKDLFTSVGRMERDMDYQRERHVVLAGNVANIDTPGYVPFDLEQVAPLEVDAGQLARTDDRMLLAPGGSSNGRSVLDPSASVDADGNAVSLERELAKIDSNRVRYSATSQLVSRRLALLRYASTGGNG